MTDDFKPPLAVSLTLPHSTVTEAINVGLIVIAELERGGYWKKKDAGWSRGFSAQMLSEAGGIRRLLAEWEQTPE